MSKPKISILPVVTLVAAFALAACGENSRFGDQGYDDAAAGASGGLGAGAAADPTSPAYFRESIGDRVLFPVNESALTAQAQQILLGQSRWLAANPDFNLTIEGHADEQGTREYNLALGARRANEAREFLISQGVAPARIKVVSFGKERPLEICSAESCYAQNRRAVTVLATGLTS